MEEKIFLLPGLLVGMKIYCIQFIILDYQDKMIRRTLDKRAHGQGKGKEPELEKGELPPLSLRPPSRFLNTRLNPEDTAT